MPRYQMKNLWTKGRLLGLSWTAVIFLLALRPIEDYDTFWQLQAGKYIWQTKFFIFQDTFSLAADAFRLEHCWLHDLILYALYTLGGYPLVSLLKTGIITLCAALLYRWSIRRGVDAAVALPVLALCLVASEPSWAERPQLWTFLFSLLYLHLLHRGRREGLRAWGWLVPIMLMWANLHAACVFGLVLIGLFGAAEIVRVRRRESSWAFVAKLSVAGLASFAVAFINPYGYRIPLKQLLAHINQYKVHLGTAGTSMVGNMEWLPPTFAQVPYFYFVVAVWGGLILWRLRRIDPAEIIFFLAFIYMGFGQIRHTTLVALLAGYYLPTALKEAIESLPDRRLAFYWTKMAIPVAFVLLFVLLSWRVGQQQWGSGLKKSEFPVAAADFILREQLPSGLYNSYDWGGYLMWRLFPNYLVFVDSRQNSPKHFDASNRIDNLWTGWEEDLDRYQINSVITRTCYYDTGGPVPLVDGLTRHPGWALVYRDDTALIFLRKEERFRPMWARLAIPPGLAYETMRAEATRLRAEDRSKDRALLSLGRSAWNLGEKEPALHFYSLFLQAEPENKEALLMMRLLRGGG